MVNKLLNFLFGFSILILFSQSSWGLIAYESNENYLPVAFNLTEEERAYLFLDQEDPPQSPPISVVDNFDYSSDFVHTWWDIDGTKVYKREFTDKIAHSGLRSMEVKFRKADRRYAWSFFAFQPKQDGIHNDFSKYDKLIFFIYVPKTYKNRPLNLVVKLEDKQHKGYEQKIEINPSKEWQLIEFKFKATDIDLSQIDNVLFFADGGIVPSAGQFWMDDIYLVKEGIDLTAPPTPKKPEVKLKENRYILSWEDVEANLYEVWASKDSGFKEPIKFITDKNYLDITELAQENYYFKVRSLSHIPELGGKASQFSQVYEYKPAKDIPPIIDVVWSQAGADTDNNYPIGALVRIAVKEKYNAKDIVEAKARIKSSSTGYDSGWVNLHLSESKDYYFFHWNTLGLKPASDYRVEFLLKDKSGQIARDDSLIITLTRSFGFIPSILYVTDNLINLNTFLPFQLTYSYQHLDDREFGKCWISSYDTHINEYADGSLELILGNGLLKYFLPQKDGIYVPQKPLSIFQIFKTDDGYLVKDKWGRKYIFNKQGRITEIKERNGNKTKFYYEGNLLKKIINPFGQELLFEHNAKGKISKIIDPYGRGINFSYRGGMLSEIQDYNGLTIKFNYYPNGKIEKIIEKRDASQRIKYFKYYDDPEGMLKYMYEKEEETERRQNFIKYEYYPEEAKIVKIFEDGGEITYVYDGFGHLIYRKDALGNERRFSYDSYGNLIKFIDENGNKYKYEYDSNSNLTKIIDPLGNEVKILYDENNLPIKIEDKKGNKIKYIYDGKGNLIKIIDPSGGETELSYNERNQLIKIIDPLDNSIRYSYDGYGNLISITDQNGEVQRYEYKDGLIWKIIDPNGNITQYNYNFPSTFLSSIIDPLGNETKYQYDEAGNITLLKDSLGRERNYIYDGIGRLLKVIYPDESKLELVYDSNSRVIQRINQNGDIISYDYDAMNRMISKTYPDGSKIEFTYDGIGNLIEVKDLNGSYKYEYDTLNRLIAESLPDGDQIRYEYDANGNLTKLIYPDGKAISYEYDELNRLIKIIDESTQEVYKFEYDSLGRRTKLIYPNEITANYKYDPKGKLIKLEYKNPQGKILKSYEYNYDANGNIIEVKAEEGNYKFNYDGLNQLIEAETPFADLKYKYDAVGNRISLTEDSKQVNYQINELNQIIQAGDTKYKYDKNGNLIEKNESGKITKYIYNYDNRLIKITHPDGSQTEYKYDYLGRRIQKITNHLGTNQLINYIYSGWQVIAETDEQGNIIKRYIYDPTQLDKPLMLEAGANKYYYIQDGMNNVVALADKEGNLVEEYFYTPYGKTINYKPSTLNQFLFSGRRYDPESGLYYFRYRYYDPGLGRFLTQEPLLSGDLFVNLVNNLNYARLNYLSLGNLKQIFKQSLDELLRQENLYRYADNNSTTKNDPLGLHKNEPRPNPCGGTGTGAGGGPPGVRRWAGWALGIAGTALGYLGAIVGTANPVVGFAISAIGAVLAYMGAAVSSSDVSGLGAVGSVLGLAGAIAGMFGFGSFAAQAALTSFAAGLGTAISGFPGGC